jgi:AraC-like DNA-binding protein
LPASEFIAKSLQGSVSRSKRKNEFENTLTTGTNVRKQIMSSNMPVQPAKWRLPDKIRKAGETYGLCIFNFARALVSPPGGYYKTPQRYFEYYSLSHLIKGSGRLWMPDAPERRVGPGDCIIMPPYEVHRYGAAEDIYCEDHLCFTGPIADCMFKCGIIRKGLVKFGTIRRLLPIMETVSSPSVDAQLEANLQLQRLLLDLYLENRNTSNGRTNLIESLLKELKKDISHWWTISEMSEYCQVGDDLLRKLFLQHTGMLPKQYLDRLRMRMAATMLTEKQQSIREIAKVLGYRDMFHFSRRFKAITGISPQIYRKRFGKRGAASTDTVSELFIDDI